jgi:hypothetical protein
MKKSLTLLLALILFSTTAYSQLDEIAVREVGSQPVYVLTTNDGFLFHVICLGIDVDFDGAYDEEDGDEYPSYWILGFQITSSPGDEVGISDPQKVTDLPFRSYAFPFRTMVEEDGDDTYLLYEWNGTIDRLKLVDGIGGQHQLTEDVLSYNASGISGDDHHYFLSVREGENSYLKVHSINKDEEVLSVDAGPMVQMSEPYAGGGTNIAVLNEGDFGEENSTIQLINFDHQGSEHSSKFIPIGGAGNYFMIDQGGQLFAVANGTHEIVQIDLVSQKIVKKVSTGTEGYNGPREICEYLWSGHSMPPGQTMAISTYDGKLLFWNPLNDEIDDYMTIEIPGKLEGMTCSEYGILAVCNISNADYSPSNKVYFYGQIVGVEDEIASEIKIWPNPVRDEFSIDFGGLDRMPENIRIIDVLGRRVAMLKYTNSISTYSVSEIGLQSGYYFVVFEVGNTKVSLPLSVTE